MAVDELIDHALLPRNGTTPFGLPYSPIRWNALFDFIIDECRALIYNNTFLTSTNITPLTSLPGTDPNNTSGDLTIESYVDDIVSVSQNDHVN